MSLKIGLFGITIATGGSQKTSIVITKHESNRRFVSSFELPPLADCPLSKIGEAALGDIIFCNYYNTASGFRVVQRRLLFRTIARPQQ
jgi:hypothetical protein